MCAIIIIIIIIIQKERETDREKGKGVGELKYITFLSLNPPTGNISDNRHPFSTTLSQEKTSPFLSIQPDVSLHRL